MLASDKIKNAFEAICDEIEKIDTVNLDDNTKESLRLIRSIAKHQSDIRQSTKGSCTAKE